MTLKKNIHRIDHRSSVLYFPDKKRGQNQHDSYVHGHDPIERILEVVGHVADQIDQDCREECCENPTQQSPLNDDLEEKYYYSNPFF